MKNPLSISGALLFAVLASGLDADAQEPTEARKSTEARQPTKVQQPQKKVQRRKVTRSESTVVDGPYRVMIRPDGHTPIQSIYIAPHGGIPNGGRLPGMFIAGPAETINLGKYWIGISCSEAPETLKSHLNIASGLVVNGAHEGAPAGKAGLQKHDVLVAANDEPLSKVPDLIAAVQKVETGELKLSVVRKGKALEVSVKPVERPAAQQNQNVTLPGWPEGLPHPPEYPVPIQRGANLLMFEPGVVVPPQAGAMAVIKIPDGATVTITRKDDNPAEIVVKRGDKEWKVDETKVDSLPPEFRASVRAMLGNGPRNSGVRLLHRLTRPVPGEPTKLAVPLNQPRPQKSELDELRDAIQKLNDKIDRLHEKSESGNE